MVPAVRNLVLVPKAGRAQLDEGIKLIQSTTDNARFCWSNGKNEEIGESSLFYFANFANSSSVKWT